MWILADSGSSKTEWRLINKENDFHFTIETEGLNPYFVSDAEIAEIVKTKILPHARNVERLYFYGAGCGRLEKSQHLEAVFSSILPEGTYVEVAGDMLAAARSLLKNESGICCILGTGANSCFYDGTEIAQIVPSLGYVLSDWGSGSVMSKDFVSQLMQKNLPDEVGESFYKTYGLSDSQLLDKIYNQPLANRFLASFSPFVLKHASEEAVKNIILDNFRQFFEYYVMQYPQLEDCNEVSIVGSVGYHFKKYLHQVADEFNVNVRNLSQFPMDGLVEYHFQQEQVS